MKFEANGQHIQHPRSRNSRYVVLFAVLALGFAIRAWVAIQWQSALPSGTLFRFGDSDSYWTMAKKIANGLPYQYGSEESKLFRAPLYPLFLAPYAWMDGNAEPTSRTAVLTARLAGCAMGTFCVALVMLIAKQWKRSGDSWLTDASLWAGGLAVLYPGAIGMSVFVLSEAVFCPLMLLSMGCVSLAIQNKRRGNWEWGLTWMLLSGASTGAGCLARPSWSLWPAVLFVYLVAIVLNVAARRQEFANAFHRRRWVLSWFLFCLGICLVMSPWWMRNYMVTGKFVPTTLQVGASLYDGWHEGASGSSDEGMEFVNAFIVEQKREDQKAVMAGDPLESTLEWRIDRRMKNAAIQWAKENSSDAIRLGLVKLRKTWSPFPVAQEIGSDAVRYFEAIGYVSIMCFALVGLWQCRSEMGAWLYAMPCVYFALLHMFFIGSVRYRQPAVLSLCALGGIGCAALARWIINHRSGAATKLDGSIASNDVTADSPPRESS